MQLAELFLSIQGESSRAGLPCTILRLAGCNLRCRYCDSVFAWEGGVAHSLEQILARVADLRCPRVLVTGGEPLLQEDCPDLVAALLTEGYEVLVETNGSQDISGLDPGAIRIVDVKTPGSGEVESFRMDNLAALAEHDEVKFVLSDATDYDWAVEFLDAHDAALPTEVLFSPAYGTLPPTDLAGWILRDRLPVRLQLQLHKVLWGAETRGV